MTRQNFPKAVKVSAIKRATKAGIVYCEACGLPCRKFQIDHINPDGLTGQPTLDNARLLCEPCHTGKTAADVKHIAKAKRREAKALGIKSDKPPIKSAGFPKTKAPARIAKDSTAHLLTPLMRACMENKNG